MVTRTRAGLTLLEVAVSAAVLGVILTTVAQVIQWSAAEHRAAQRKRCALESATTVLDRLTVRDWSAITPESAAAIPLPAEAVQWLVAPHLVVTVAEETQRPGPLKNGTPASAKRESPPAKRITVELSWANRAGGPNEHVRLSTWVFRRGLANGAKQ